MLRGYRESLEKAIPDNWEIGILSDVSEIKFSNVDKIASSDEAPISLCNYLDVYNNEYIDGRIEFMPATAIGKFALKKGDVIITKDSETPDDIAKPAVVVQDLTNVLCGYHLALIRPDSQRVDSVFLGKMLASKTVNHQFERLAQGLTRFGLEVYSIKNALIAIPPQQAQRKIAEILSTVDEVIEKTDAIIEETQQLKNGVMQKLFTEGIEHTKFKETKIGLIECGTIPIDWDEVELNSICNVTSSKRIMMHEYVDSGIPFYRSKEIIEKMMNISHDKILYISESRFQDIRRKFGAPQNGDILMTAVGSLGIPYLIDDDENFYFKDGNLLWLRDISVEIDKRFLIYYFESFGFKKAIEVITAGSSQKALTIEKLEKLRIPLPNSSEQQMITQILSEVDAKIGTEHAFKAELEQLKKGLMQALLTGKVRVKV